MFSMDLTSREGDGRMVVALRGKLDVSEAASVADAVSYAERSLATGPAAGHLDPLTTGRCAVLASG